LKGDQQLTSRLIERGAIFAKQPTPEKEVKK
jgi:hypothetical protein